MDGLYPKYTGEQLYGQVETEDVFICEVVVEESPTVDGYATYLDTGAYVFARSEGEARSEAIRHFIEMLQRAARGEETIELLVELDEEGELQR